MVREKKAFTLVELLVVLAVIVLLIAVVAPPVARGREYAKSIVCKVNLSKYYVAMEHYLADNDDTYPFSHTSIVDAEWSSNRINCQWHDERAQPWNDERYAGALWPYMETSKIHGCPTFKRFAIEYGGTHPNHHPAIPIEPQYSYSQNVFLGRSLGVLKKSEVVDPDRVFVFAEETLWVIKDGSDYLANHVLNDTTFFARHPHDPIQAGDCFATYHRTSLEKKDEGLGNAVFVDGHVAFVDAWKSHKTSWGSVSSSFYHAWPKENVLSQQIPY